MLLCPFATLQEAQPAMSKSEKYSWVTLMGTFEEGTEGLIFKGREFPVPPQQKEAAAGPTDKATEPEVSSGSTDR